MAPKQAKPAAKKESANKPAPKAKAAPQKKDAKPAPKGKTAKPAPKETKEAKPAPKDAKSKAKTAPKPKKDTKAAAPGVFIKGLDFEGMNHHTVRLAFKQFDDITEVRLRHKKYTILFFKSAESAQKALELDKKMVKGNRVQISLIKRAKPTRDRREYCTSVYVGGLGGKTTKTQLCRHFKKCGRILKVRVLNKPRPHAFVYFKTTEAAQKAVAMKNVPWSYGKDCEAEKVPKWQQFKLQIRLSIRTIALDKKVYKKRYNRAPPSVIRAREEKSRRRKERRAAIKKAREEAKAKAKAKKGSEKKGSEKKGSATKKGSSTKKGSTTKKDTKKDAKKDTKKQGSAKK